MIQLRTENRTEAMLYANRSWRILQNLFSQNFSSFHNRLLQRESYEALTLNMVPRRLFTFDPLLGLGTALLVTLLVA